MVHEKAVNCEFGLLGTRIARTAKAQREFSFLDVPAGPEVSRSSDIHTFD
jgi:hypothetical protein